MMSIPVTIIVGPTACGKTARSIELAKECNGEIVNADSLQLFKDLPILTAQPTMKEREGIPHHMFGMLGPLDRPSVKWWLGRCVAHIMEIQERGKYPIIVGGTGFYIDALINGLSEIPDISAKIKDHVANQMAVSTRDEFYDIVTKHDPLVADIKPNDQQRLQRALEVFLETGKSLRSFQGQKKKLINIQAEVVYINMARDILYDRINRRFDLMLEHGALDEVNALKDLAIPKNAPVMHAIGAKEIYEYLNGSISLDEAITLAKQFSRNYAKRQITWFNNQLNAK